jgi:hypothetical protein
MTRADKPVERLVRAPKREGPPERAFITDSKKHSGRYRAGERGWVKTKNPDYWRRKSEIEGVRRSIERRRARV